MAQWPWLSVNPKLAFMTGSAWPRSMVRVAVRTPTSRHNPYAAERDLALLRPKRAARWVAGGATAVAAVIAGVVAHQLPGAAAATAPGSTSSTTPGSTSGTSGSSSSSGSTTGSSTAPTPTVTPSTTRPVVVSGGSSVR